MVFHLKLTVTHCTYNEKNLTLLSNKQKVQYFTTLPRLHKHIFRICLTTLPVAYLT